MISSWQRTLYHRGLQRAGSCLPFRRSYGKTRLSVISVLGLHEGSPVEPLSKSDFSIGEDARRKKNSDFRLTPKRIFKLKTKLGSKVGTCCTLMQCQTRPAGRHGRNLERRHWYALALGVSRPKRAVSGFLVKAENCSSMLV